MSQTHPHPQRSRLLPFAPSTTPLHATTYLLGISLFSIAFLVFLNSAVSFVVTDLLNIKEGVGGVVGTLGFVDEIVALTACPLWGLASDRLGVRWVAVLGYGIIGIALFAFVQARTVAGLVVGRVVFALGASAAATMVTAALPVLTGDGEEEDDDDAVVKKGRVDEEEGQQEQQRDGSGAVTADVEEEEARSPNGNHRNHQPRASVATSLESDATITPERFTREQQPQSDNGVEEDENDKDGEDDDDDKGRRPSALAGYVGLFTGCGALVALALFLPLPARFSQRDGVTPAQAITYSFYVVGGVAFFVALFVFIGFIGLKGEEEKGWRMLLGVRSVNTTPPKARTAAQAALLSHATPQQREHHQHHHHTSSSSDDEGAKAPLPYTHLLLASLRLGLTDPHIALGYLGGFVARASTVAISLFVPLYVNAYFIGHGFCRGNPDDPSPDLKRECRAAYVLASALTGAAQLVALLCAPLFGYLSGRGRRQRGGTVGSGGKKGIDVNVPVLVAAGLGVIGYAAFPQLPSPEFIDKDGRGGNPAVFLIVALLGISQIGAIVCSLGSLGRGVLGRDVAVDEKKASSGGGAENDGSGNHPEAGETEALLGGGNGSRNGTAGETTPSPLNPASCSRIYLKGSIAGVYSLCGGAAILLLTKLGGFLFDTTVPGAPFYMMAAFNGVLFVVSLGIDVFGKKRI